MFIQIKKWLPLVAVLLWGSCSDETTPVPDAAPPAADLVTVDVTSTVKSDMEPDQPAPTRTYTIFNVTHTGSELNLAQATWNKIPTEDLIIDSTGGAWLLILNVPETWNDTLLAETRFSLRVDGQEVVQGVYSTAVAGQRMPISLITVEQLAAGSHTIEAYWKNATADATSSIGAVGTLSLIAMKVPDDTQFSTQGPGTAHTFSGSAEALGLEDLTLSVSEKAHYLVVMNVPQIKNDLSKNDGDGALWYTLMHNNGILAAGGTFLGVADQYMPMTLIGVKELDVGEHTLHAVATSGDGTATMGPEGKALLAAIRLPAGAIFQRRANSALANNSPDWADIADLDSISIESMGDKHLLIFIAPDTWNDTAGGGPWFSINVDGADVGQGVYWSGIGQQRVCATIMSVVDLPTGTHTIKARWKHPGPGTAYLGANSHTWVIGLK